MEKAKIHTITKLIIRILLGAFFITTAILKLLSIDSFEIYIYSFNLFSFNMCAIVARLIIAAEMLLGTFLIAKILYKPVWWLSMLMMIGFTLFLIYVALFRSDTNCHCMGDLVELNPTYSILKNLVTIVLLLLVRKEEDYQFKGKTIVGIVITLLAVGLPFIIFPTDSIYNLIRKPNYVVNEKPFQEFMQDSTAQSLHIDKGNYVLGYLAAGCKYCKLSAKKVNSLVANNQLDTNNVVFLIWGSDSSIQHFKEETGATHFRYAFIHPVMAIKTVNGVFPSYVFVKDGKPVDILDFRELNDKNISEFLSK